MRKNRDRCPTCGREKVIKPLRVYSMTVRQWLSLRGWPEGKLRQQARVLGLTEYLLINRVSTYADRMLRHCQRADPARVQDEVIAIAMDMEDWNG